MEPQGMPPASQDASGRRQRSGRMWLGETGGQPGPPGEGGQRSETESNVEVRVCRVCLVRVLCVYVAEDGLSFGWTSLPMSRRCVPYNGAN